MNRLERRAAKARSRSLKPDPVVAIHEAGHAVGRIITAKTMGFKNEEAIAFIDMNWGAPYVHGNGDMVLMPRATTYGPMYSRPMTDFLIANPVAQTDPTSRVSLILDVARCKAAGIDVVGWAKAKAIICMFGPVAEAIYTQSYVESVIESPECGGDLNDAVRDCSLAGMSADDRVATIYWAIETATTMLGASNVWRSVKALANDLPSSGRLQGHRAAQIIERALEWPTL
jgi:hypothetical protein